MAARPTKVEIFNGIFGPGGGARQGPLPFGALSRSALRALHASLSSWKLIGVPSAAAESAVAGSGAVGTVQSYPVLGGQSRPGSSSQHSLSQIRNVCDALSTRLRRHTLDYVLMAEPAKVALCNDRGFTGKGRLRFVGLFIFVTNRIYSFIELFSTSSAIARAAKPRQKVLKKRLGLGAGPFDGLSRRIGSVITAED